MKKLVAPMALALAISVPVVAGDIHQPAGPAPTPTPPPCESCQQPEGATLADVGDELIQTILNALATIF